MDKTIEGIFNGEQMVDEDGREYSVNPNYASKSKLVEGDKLKLTIKDDGSFVYKQIEPAPRKRVVGTVQKSLDGKRFYVVVGNNMYNVLYTSISYYKAKTGDTLALLVPSSGNSTWAAVENIIRNDDESEEF